MERTYISAGVEYNRRDRHVNAPIFQRAFDWEYGKVAARLEISVAGFYRLFLNGKELTKGYFAPYISNPDQTLFYDEYEVGELLKEKGNELYVLLGNGLTNCNDCGIWDFESAPFRAAPKLYLGLYAGETRVLTTDGKFRVSDSPLTFDDLRAGERYDARLEESLFSSWRKPVFAPQPKGAYVKCEAQPILEAGRLRPASVRRTPRGYVYDFGENNAGTFRLKLCGKEGQRLVFTPFEVQNADGDPDLRNITFERTDTDYFQHVEYVCKEGEQEYTPSFSYFGFRYILVEGLTAEQANEELLAFVVLHSAIEKRGSFSCSDQIINRVQECVERSDLSNFFYFPNDCPQREKNGWTGDICVSAEQYCYNFYAYPSLRQWLSCVRAAQLPSGEIPGIVPTGGWGYAWGNGMAWDDVLSELPVQLYRFTGKREILEENIDAILRYCDYMRSKRTSAGLLDYGLGDWCEAGTLNESTRTPVEITATLIGTEFLERTAFILTELGRNAEAENARREAESLRAAFRRKYVTAGRVSVQTQTAQVMALCAGVFPKEEQEAAYQELKARIAADGEKLRVGILGMKRLFELLSANGDSALALKMIVGPQFPSYGYLIEQGATTLWELFEDLEWKDGLLRRKNGVPGLGSFNHHFFGSVSAWFYQALAGVQVVSYGKLRVDPAYDCGLEFAEGTYRDDRASVRVKWEKQGDGYALTVENTGFVGTVVSPDGREYPLTNGKNTYQG